jgi:hypothetical protein
MAIIFGSSGNCGERGDEIRLFISLLAQRNEPKKGPPCLLSRRGRDSLCSSMLPGLCKLAALRQCKSPFQQPLRCSAACQWDFSYPPPFVLPRLADGGGKRRGNCLRAKPEFFRVPPSARSKGSPQGQDWLGCLFLVSSFGHAKEEKRTAKRSRYFLRNSRMNLKKGGVSPAFFYARIRKQMLPGLCLIPQGQDWESAC